MITALAITTHLMLGTISLDSNHGCKGTTGVTTTTLTLTITVVSGETGIVIANVPNAASEFISTISGGGSAGWASVVASGEVSNSDSQILWATTAGAQSSDTSIKVTLNTPTNWSFCYMQFTGVGTVKTSNSNSATHAGTTSNNPSVTLSAIAAGAVVAMGGGTAISSITYSNGTNGTAVDEINPTSGGSQGDGYCSNATCDLTMSLSRAWSAVAVEMDPPSAVPQMTVLEAGQ